MEEDKDSDASSSVKQTPKTKPARKSRSSKLKGKSLLVLALLLIIAIASSFYFYTKYNDAQNKLKHPEVVVKTETQSLVDKVSKHAELPSGEQPTVATVSDVSKLAKQTFFANAKNGDKVMIYSKAKKAILYRTSEDRIINIAPLNINSKQ